MYSVVHQALHLLVYLKIKFVISVLLSVYNGKMLQVWILKMRVCLILLDISYFSFHCVVQKIYLISLNADSLSTHLQIATQVERIITLPIIAILALAMIFYNVTKS